MKKSEEMQYIPTTHVYLQVNGIIQFLYIWIEGRRAGKPVGTCDVHFQLCWIAPKEGQAPLSWAVTEVSCMDKSLFGRRVSLWLELHLGRDAIQVAPRVFTTSTRA